MARRFNASLFRSQMRQVVNKYNQGIRKYNDAVRKLDQERRRAINTYNQEIRKYNATQRSQQQKIKSAITQLNRTPIFQSYSIIVASTRTLGQAYARLEDQAAIAASPDQERLIIDLPQKETANSLDVINALNGCPGVSPSGWRI